MGSNTSDIIAHCKKWTFMKYRRSLWNTVIFFRPFTEIIKGAPKFRAILRYCAAY